MNQVPPPNIIEASQILWSVIIVGALWIFFSWAINKRDSDLRKMKSHNKNTHTL